MSAKSRPRSRSPGKTPDIRISSSESGSRAASGASRTRSPAASAKNRNRSPQSRGKSAASSRMSSSGAKTPLSAKSRGSGNASRKSSAVVRRTRIQAVEIESRGLTFLDLSGQGMTAVASTTFLRKAVGELNLSSNNLRQLPGDVSKLTNLCHLDISKNGIRCGHPKDFSGLPLELGQLANLTVLCISECNLPFIPPAIWKCRSLRALDISRNKINVLAPDVGNLSQLRHLDAQQTSIMTLPPEVALCQELEEILLWGNAIESLPETLREIPNLRVLAINYKSFSAAVDDYRDTLIRKGQIQSEHIPPVLFDIPALAKLDLEDTKLNFLPERCHGKYKEVYLGRNFFYKLPRMVLQIPTLETLDISENKLSVIPDAIDSISTLRALRLNDNDIEKIPLSIGNMKQLRELNLGGNKISGLPEALGRLENLQSLLLDRNQIRNIPDSLSNLECLETLDLTDNLIASLPISFHKMAALKTAHSYRKLHKHGLWLHKNPLRSPPEEVWKTDEPKGIFEHLRRLQIQRTENLQRQKLIVLGEVQCGKTSLVHAMTAGKSLLTQATADSTALVDFFAWRTQNGVDLLVHDLGGADAYRTPTQLYLDPKALYLLVYDHRKYTTQNHQAALGVWLDMLLTHAPGAVVKIAGTQIDQCSEDFALKIKDQVEEQVQQQMAERADKIQQEVVRVDAMLRDIEGGRSAQEIEQLSRQRARLVTLGQTSLRLQNDISLVTAGEGIQGVPQLVSSLEVLAVDSTLFPHAQRQVPGVWDKFRLALKKRRDFFLTLDTVLQTGKQQYELTRADVLQCLNHLCDIGEIMWFQHNPALRKVVFHRPVTLTEILRGLFRHDLEEFLDYDQNRLFFSRGLMSREIFDQATLQYKVGGQISRNLLLCMWFHLTLSGEDFTTLLDLIPHLGLCYVTPLPEVPLPPQEYVPMVAIPAFNREDDLKDDLESIWPASPRDSQKQVSLTLTFPLIYPHGLFEKLSCSVHNCVQSRMDWQNLVVGETSGGTLLLRRYLDPETYDCVIQITVRDDDVTKLTQCLGSIVAELKVTLCEYRGSVWYLRSDTKNCENIVKSECLPKGLASI